MAIYHLSAKIISRKTGRSATAAAAYRAAERIDDRRTGEIHDYTKKRGIEHAEIILPSGVNWTPGRAELWNAVEAKNKRQDAQVAREFVVALPDELTAEARQRLAVQFAREIADTYRVAADVAIHAPGREGDHRNHHAHILTSTNTLNPDGTFGIDRAPTRHMGPSVSGMVRRGADSEVARRIGEEANARLFAARETGRIERELAEAGKSILDLSGDLAKAKAIRDHMPKAEDVEKGKAEARQAYERFKAEQAAQAEAAKLKAEQEAERERQRQARQQPKPRDRGMSR